MNVENNDYKYYVRKCDCYSPYLHRTIQIASDDLEKIENYRIMGKNIRGYYVDWLQQKIPL